MAVHCSPYRTLSGAVVRRNNLHYRKEDFSMAIFYMVGGVLVLALLLHFLGPKGDNDNNDQQND